jgi:hypothetical protein
MCIYSVLQNLLQFFDNLTKMRKKEEKGGKRKKEELGYLYTFQN